MDAIYTQLAGTGISGIVLAFFMYQSQNTLKENTKAINDMSKLILLALSRNENDNVFKASLDKIRKDLDNG